MKIGTKLAPRPPRPPRGTGECSFCGYGGKLDVEGHMGWHKTRRVGPGGRVYIADEVCPGYGEKPEPLECTS